jgi:hypothetical protein
MTNNRHANVIPVARFNLAHSRLQISTIAAKEPIKAMMTQTSRGDDDYRSRMVANALVGGFVGVLVVSAYEIARSADALGMCSEALLCRLRAACPERTMSRTSRKAQHRRKWKRRLAYRAVSPADAMNQALGEFFTEMGRVEFQMLLLMDFLNEAPLEAAFAETTGKPFGERIKSFKTWCDSGVPDNQKPAMQAIYMGLDELLPKRNFLVHGETREGAGFIVFKIPASILPI